MRNVADPATGLGSVGYSYKMGTYDVTAAQYAQFLNAVATTSDPYGLYNAGMANAPSTGPFSVGCGISQTVVSLSFSYSVAAGDQNLPVNWTTWGDAARFCNWLDNGQPAAPEGNGTTETGAYTLSGDTANLLTETRNPGAKYCLPTWNEWYKAAYYMGDGTASGYWVYPTKSNTAPSNQLSATGTNNANFYDVHGIGYTDLATFLTPVGYFEDSPSSYGTYDMGGDVGQWTEFAQAPYRGAPCDSFSYSLYGAYYLQAGSMYYSVPTAGSPTIGFRVASVPEPGSMALLLAAALALGIWRLRHEPTR